MYFSFFTPPPLTAVGVYTTRCRKLILGRDIGGGGVGGGWGGGGVCGVCVGVQYHGVTLI